MSPQRRLAPDARTRWRGLGPLALTVLLTACAGERTVFVGSHRSAGEGGGDTGGAGGTGAASCRALPGRHTLTLLSAGVLRRFELTVPETYEASRAYPLVLGFHAGGATAVGVRAQLGLEAVTPSDWAIFAYPEALTRQWDDGRVSTGWQNGPDTAYLGGTEDLAFVRDLLAYLEAELCIRVERRFAVGYGWGGDFASVVGCYLGDLFAAAVPVLANDPYFLPPLERPVPRCLGEAAVWVLHPKGAPDYPPEFGARHRDFWREEHACSADGATPLGFSGMVADDECEEYSCSGPRTRYCSYTATVALGLPEAYFAPAVGEFLRGFL